MGGEDGNSEEGEIDYSDIKHGYLLADQFAMAVACLDDVIIENKPAYATVDIGLSDSRGRMDIDWDRCGPDNNNVTIIRSVDMSKIKSLLDKAFSVC